MDTSIILTRFDGNRWTPYELGALKPVCYDCKILEMTKEEAQCTSAAFIGNTTRMDLTLLKKERIRVVVYCTEEDTVFMEQIKSLQKQVSASSHLFALEVYVTTTYRIDKEHYQEHTSIRNYEDIHFDKNNTCYVIVEDLLTVVDLIQMCSDYMI